MTALAKGEVTGVREESLRLRDFEKRKYWPTIQPTLSRWEQQRTRSILDNQILPRFGDLKLSGLRREAIERWQAERGTAVSGATCNKELMRLKHLLNRAVAWGYLRESPARAITKAKEAPGRVRYLSPDELDLLLNGRRETVTASDGRRWTIQRAPDPALKLYIVAALQSGGRRSELLNLRWADVDMKTQTITFRQTKNGDARTIPMTATLRALIHALPRPLDPDAHVLPQRSPQALSRAFGYLVTGLRDQGSPPPRSSARLRIDLDDGGRLTARGDGDAGPPRSANESALPAPLPGASARRRAGARHPSARAG
jgi:integrase